MVLDSRAVSGYTVGMMKVGDLVTMDTPLTPERYGVGLIRKIVPARAHAVAHREIYHILWPDETVSMQFEDEIVVVTKV